jgi:hypothetical protein
MEEGILNGLLFLISVATFLYALSLLPKRIDYGKIRDLLKRYFFKVAAVVLLLYSVGLTWMHEKGKEEDRENRDALYTTMDSLDSCRKESNTLRARIDSLMRTE